MRRQACMLTATALAAIAVTTTAVTTTAVTGGGDDARGVRRRLLVALLQLQPRASRLAERRRDVHVQRGRHLGHAPVPRGHRTRVHAGLGHGQHERYDGKL